MADINLGQHNYTPERATAFVDELRERLDRNGALESVSILRFEGGYVSGGSITIDGVERELASSLSYRAVDEIFFSTIGLPIVDGRGFDR